MRHLGPWQCLAGCTLLFAAASHATVYEINSASDVDIDVAVVDEDSMVPWDKDTVIELTPAVEDGFCSIREAVYASNYRMAVDGCEAGTGNDSIKLQRDTVYTLTEGELPIGFGEKVVVESEEVPNPDTPDPNDTMIEYNVSFEPLANQIRFDMQLDVFEEVEDQILPIITSAHASRLIHIDEGGAISLNNMELKDGDANADDGNGGLIKASGTIIVGQNVTLSGGVATNGGGIYMTEGSGVAFQNGGRFENNIASGVGSVIASSPTFDGQIIGYDFYMAGNLAQGGPDAGVIHMDGDSASRIGLELGNGTITHNQGGVINVVSDNYLSVLVNMTIAFNDGTALTLAETAFADPAEADTTDHILHTVMVGNTNVCGGVLDSSYVYTNADAAPRLLFTITDDPDCPLPDEQTLGTPVTSNPNGAESDIFLGENGVACDRLASGAGVSSCTPMSAEDLDGPYPGFRPNPLPAAVDPDSPDYVADDAASLFDRGNPENVAIDQCEATDNRGKSRGGPGGRCDVGAIEFLRAQAQPDEIDLISGSSVLGDVVANDLNDTTIDCRNLDDVIVDEGICAANDEPCLEQARLDRCLTVVEPPERGSAVPVIDDNGYPRIRYTPASSFHGVDQIRYQVDKDAFFGGADLGLNQSEITNFVAEPASGLTEKKSIGSQGIGVLLLVMVAGMVRRSRGMLRGLVAMVALVTGSQALAVDIEVDSLADDVPPIKNDGHCTLREALENAAEAGSPDCAYGGNSTDTILLPAGVIELQETLVIESGGVELVGKGARDDDTDDEDTLTRIIRSEAPGTPPFRLFEVQPPNSSSGHPSVRFQFLTLENGYAAGVGDAGSGAVIVTGGSVIFDRVRILNNQADADGGVAFVRSNAGNEKILTFNNSFVSGNSAGGAGGVMSSTAQNGESFKVALIGSTFAGNGAVDEGGVLDANIAAGEVQIANSTFLDNSANKGSVLDFSGLTVNANIMNSSFMNNTGGSGIDLGDAPTLTRLFNSAYFDSGSVCTTGTTILHDSQYNAFSAAACVATTESNNQTGVGSGSLSASLSDVDGEGTGTRGDYVPPYLPIIGGDTDMVLVDTGNDQDSLASGTASPAACRAEDLRGIARTSGGSCDIGAFEYQQITAEDDEASNQSILVRKVPVDIFDNDLPSDGAEIAVVSETTPYSFLQDRFEFEEAELINTDPEEYGGTSNFFDPVSGEPTRYELISATDTTLEGSVIEFVWKFYNEDREGYALKCGDPIPQDIIANNPDLFEDGDVADECVILFIPPSSEAFESRMCSSTDENPVKVFIRYTFEDSSLAEVTEPALVEMTLTDKPPVLKGRSTVNQPGQKVVFTLDIEDPDNPDAEIDWTRYNVTLAKEPSFTKSGEYGEVEGVGLIIEDRYDEDAIPHSDPADADKPATVTYIPESNYNTFKDSFTLKVEDMNCGGTSRQAQFSIRYINEETSAAAGSFGWGLLGSVLLLLRRRFAAA